MGRSSWMAIRERPATPAASLPALIPLTHHVDTNISFVGSGSSETAAKHTQSILHSPLRVSVKNLLSSSHGGAEQSRHQKGLSSSFYRGMGENRHPCYRSLRIMHTSTGSPAGENNTPPTDARRSSEQRLKRPKTAGLLYTSVLPRKTRDRPKGSKCIRPQTSSGWNSGKRGQVEYRKIKNSLVGDENCEASCFDLSQQRKRERILSASGNLVDNNEKLKRLRREASMRITEMRRNTIEKAQKKREDNEQKRMEVIAKRKEREDAKAQERAEIYAINRVMKAGFEKQFSLFLESKQRSK